MIDRLIVHRMFWLLVALILTLVVSPIIDMYGESSHRLYLALLTTVLMISAVYAASVSRMGRIVKISATSSQNMRCTISRSIIRG